MVPIPYFKKGFIYSILHLHALVSGFLCLRQGAEVKPIPGTENWELQRLRPRTAVTVPSSWRTQGAAPTLHLRAGQEGAGGSCCSSARRAEAEKDGGGLAPPDQHEACTLWSWQQRARTRMPAPSTLAPSTQGHSSNSKQCRCPVPSWPLTAAPPQVPVCCSISVLGRRLLLRWQLYPLCPQDTGERSLASLCLPQPVRQP